MNLSLWTPPAVLAGLVLFLWVATWLDRLVERPPVQGPVHPGLAAEGQTHA